MNEQEIIAELERLRPAAIRIAARTLGNLQDAEDATQEAMVKAWQSWQRYDPARGTVKSWYLAIVNNQALAQRRKNGRGYTSPLPRQVEDPAPVPTDHNGTAAQIQELPPKQRAVIGMKAQGYTHAEIADATGLTIRAVERNAQKARRRLRQEKRRIQENED